MRVAVIWLCIVACKSQVLQAQGPILAAVSVVKTSSPRCSIKVPVVGATRRDNGHGDPRVQPDPWKVGAQPSHYLRSSSNGAHCGIYALIGALRALEVSVNWGELLDGRYVGSRAGSSAAELRSAAESVGARAVGYVQGNIPWLRLSPDPILMLLRGSRRAERTNHWVVYLGDADGRARIFDPPRHVEDVAYSDLLALWDGTAIRITRAEERGHDLIDSLASVQWLISCLVPPLALVIVFRSTSQLLPTPKLGSPTISGTIAQVLLILGAAAACGHVVHYASSVGFGRNWRALSEAIGGPLTAAPAPEVSLKMLTHWISCNAVSVVDARPPRMLLGGCIPGSVNLPVDASLGELDDALRRIPHGKRIVVYCQGGECEWDLIVAARLRMHGYEDVRVFTPGWRGWVKTPTKEMPSGADM